MPIDILSLSFLSFVYHLNSPSVGNIAKVSPLASHLALASYQLMNSLWSCRHVLAMGFNTYSGGHGAVTADSAAGDSSSSSMTMSFAKKKAELMLMLMPQLMPMLMLQNKF